MVIKTDPTTIFALDSVDTRNPARITQRDWVQDDAFVSIIRTSWHSQYADYIGSKAADSLFQKVHASGKIYEHNVHGTLVAILDGRLVGIASVRDLQKLFLITMLEVVPEHQGNGIATQLLNALCTVPKPLLVHVSIHRPLVKRFYAKQGFKTLAPEEIEHYGHSMVFDVMVKT
ncbi:MAG: GNAT superfamily N-acetyltransferase [Granulosicoccus sp.]